MQIGNVAIDSYIEPPTVTRRFRGRSVVYTLDGTAKEDRLGGTKLILTLPFKLLPSEVWETLKPLLAAQTISVTGYVGVILVNGTYRLSGNDIPTPILVVKNGLYRCQPFTVTLEEI